MSVLLCIYIRDRTHLFIYQLLKLSLLIPGSNSVEGGVANDIN
ncbi:MAG TPA: hypothetical protein V6D15_21885 [Oculatellaceae cyanobacterium]